MRCEPRIKLATLAARRAGSLRAFRSAHSQITSTRQPSARNASVAASSRFLLSVIFLRQKLRRDAGQRNAGQLCWCQKHPCTKTTARCRGNTRSGRPGSLRSCSRYRRPRRNSARRMRSSGAVSVPRMRLMLALRCAGVIVSASVLLRQTERALSSSGALRCSRALRRTASISPARAAAISGGTALPI